MRSYFKQLQRPNIRHQALIQIDFHITVTDTEWEKISNQKIKHNNKL